MTEQLLFEGEQVQLFAAKITKAGDGLSDSLTLGKVAYHNGDEVAFILRAKTVAVTFKTDKNGITTRLHTFATLGITDVDLELAERLIAEDAEKVEKAKADAAGQGRLGDGDED